MICDICGHTLPHRDDRERHLCAKLADMHKAYAHSQEQFLAVSAEVERLKKENARIEESTTFAWKNVRILEKARQELLSKLENEHREDG